ncbi:MAG TPA: hypothetical protein VFS75_01665 [Candidatus Paceibacterota bacterium]|nr:hypothetical protein [Candidatus Paceibacterota bacterium]
MSRTNIIWVLILAIIVVVIAIVFFMKSPATTPADTAAIGTTTTTVAPETVESYVTANLDDLIAEATTSTSSATASYDITGYEAHGGAGTVRYTDGTTTHTADFTYNVDERGYPSVTSFTIRQ